jgi:hypothetical protein
MPSCALLAVFLITSHPEIGADTNTFYGDGAGDDIGTGINDTGFGHDALNSNDTGSTNTATGAAALLSNKDGSHNTAIGSGAMAMNINGVYNTAIGLDALVYNTNGGYNTALGLAALFSTTGSYNIALGAGAGQSVTTGSYNIDIGNDGLADDSYGIRIGTDDKQAHAYMAGIFPVTLAGLPVRVSPSGKLAATILSSARFKQNIQPMEKSSEAILSLQPVTFRYKTEFDPDEIRQFGLVAEDVAKVSPDLVVRDASGKPYAVCYDTIDAMLLNEFLKTHRKVEREVSETQSQKMALGELRTAFANQEKDMSVLSDGVQKMANELMLTKPTARLVGTNTSLGQDALAGLTTGVFNSALGSNALHFDTTGSNNTAIGCNALYNNLAGNDNTATGREALYANKADSNTAIGAHSLHANNTGYSNTAAGKYACYNSTDGSNNIALGYQAGWNLVSFGVSNNILIGNMGSYGQTETIWIGDPNKQTNAYMAGVHDALTLLNIPRLYIDANCHLGIMTSSARFKQDIQPMGKASEALFSLRPVTFRYKKKLDPKGILQFGLVAEDVAAAEPDLVVRDAAGKPYAVRYEAVSAMLLNEYLKTHRQVEEELGTHQAQAAAVKQLRSTLAERRKQIAALRRDARDLTRELALSKPMMRQVACTTPSSDNTFCGDGAGAGITSCDCNSGFGYNALHNEDTGDYATAIGSEALSANKSGSNVALGNKTLFVTTDSVYNTGAGVRALYKNTSGKANTAVGRWALYNNTSGSYNIGLGSRAGYNLTTGDYNIDIGNEGKAGDSNTIRIGTEGTQIGAFIAGVYTETITSGLGVVVDDEGHLGTTTSSARFKENIRPMKKASEAVFALRPVTFCYQKNLAPEGVRQFGLVAEEVAKVNPDLVARDAKGNPYTVRYEAVNAMLLNEFLKLHRQVAQEMREHQAQAMTLSQLRFGLAEQEKKITALRVGFQAIHFQLKLNAHATRVVAQN